MGRALPGVELEIEDGELVLEPASVPTFFLGYLGEDVRRERRRTAAVALERAARPGPASAGAPATASAATRTAGCTSRVAPTT